jgi:hypothetical protein
MSLARTTVGCWHLIAGTVSEVLTELNTMGIKAENIAVMATDGTSCIFRHGV